MAFSKSSPVFLCISFIMWLAFCSLRDCHALGGRETTESNSFQHTHHNVPVSSLLPSSVCSPSTKGGPKRSLKVVHIHGPCSHVTRDKASAPTLVQILSHDQSRVNSIQSRLASPSSENSLRGSKTTVPVKPGSSLGVGNYIVTVGLGTPKRDLSLIFDTGSGVSWTQCRPCFRYCYKQQQPIFDPSRSASYSNVSCDSPLCSDLINVTGNDPGCFSTTCLYGVLYGDASFTVGFFGRERLTLTPSDVFDGFLFGCGQNNRGLFGEAAGLLGLGRDEFSFVSQTAYKYGKYFSYCLPSASSSNGYLSFGKPGVPVPPAVKFTRLLTNSERPAFYFIEVVAISVGGRRLPISRSVFSKAGAIIDSGTLITRLPPAAYGAMRSAFRELMKKYPAAKGLELLDTCYDFSDYATVEIPKIGFYFGGEREVEVDLNLSGILYGINNSQLCLAFAGNKEATDLAVFGNAQQQKFAVVYDVAGGRLGFGSGGCD